MYLCTRIEFGSRFILLPITCIIKITNERRKLQRKEERVNAKKDKLFRAHNHSILSETTRDVCNRTQTDLYQDVVHKKAETIQVTTFIHQRVEEADKKNANQLEI